MPHIAPSVKRELQFKRRHNCSHRRLPSEVDETQTKEIESDDYDQVPDGNKNGELDGAQFCQAKRTAAARPRAATQIGIGISRICASENIRIAVSPLK